VLASHGVHGLPFGQALLELIAVVKDDVELWRVLAEGKKGQKAATYPFVLSEVAILVEAWW
jgi:hypothetical protein